MSPTLHHIDLRVRELEVALPFYDVFLSALGFGERTSHTESSGKLWYRYRAQHAETALQLINVTLDVDHHANQTAIAFRVDASGEVDRIAELVTAAGAVDVEPPELWPDYGDTYYGLFFKDPSGNRWEVASW